MSDVVTMHPALKSAEAWLNKSSKDIVGLFGLGPFGSIELTDTLANGFVDTVSINGLYVVTGHLYVPRTRGKRQGEPVEFEAGINDINIALAATTTTPREEIGFSRWTPNHLSVTHGAGEAACFPTLTPQEREDRTQLLARAVSITASLLDHALDGVVTYTAQTDFYAHQVGTLFDGIPASQAAN